MISYKNRYLFQNIDFKKIFRHQNSSKLNSLQLNFFSKIKIKKTNPTFTNIKYFFNQFLHFRKSSNHNHKKIP